MSERNPKPQGPENGRFRDPLSGDGVLAFCTGILLVLIAAGGIVYDALSRL